MCAKSSKRSSSKPSWHVEQVRCTLFTPNGVELDRALWNRVTNKIEPTDIRSAPNTIYVGAMDGARVSMGAAGLRCDLSILPAAEQIGFPPSIGAMADAVAKLRPLADRLLSNRVVQRLALGAILVREVASIPDGNSLLLKYVPDLMIKNPAGVEDIHFQINRKRLSKAHSVKGFHINRLSKWTVQQVLPAVVQGKNEISVMQHARKTVFRAEFDLNTPHDFEKPIPASKTVKIFNELCELAKELSTKGDVP